MVWNSELPKERFERAKPKLLAHKNSLDEEATDEMAAQIATARDRYMGVHVIPQKEKWKVRRSGSLRAYGIYSDQKTAMAAARAKMKNSR